MEEALNIEEKRAHTFAKSNKYRIRTKPDKKLFEVKVLRNYYVLHLNKYSPFKQ